MHNSLKWYYERLLLEAIRTTGLFKKRKLFIHIPKGAGMTIRRSPNLANKIKLVSRSDLISNDYYLGLLSKMNSIGDHHGLEHARYRDLNKDTQNKYQAFAVVRNPWDRVVSRYFFAKQVLEVEQKYEKDKHNVSSFEHFLEERFVWGDQPYMWHRAIRGWYPSFDYVVNETGEISADIIRFENLNEEICRYFNIERMDRARNVTKARNGLNKKDIYTPKTIQIVADWYKADIEAFGFDFDTSAQKNAFYSN